MRVIDQLVRSKSKCRLKTGWRRQMSSGEARVRVHACQRTPLSDVTYDY